MTFIVTIGTQYKILIFASDNNKEYVIEIEKQWKLIVCNLIHIITHIVLWRDW